MNYVIYDINGEITTWGSCDVPNTPAAGLALLEGTGTSFTHYVKNRSLIAYSSDQVAAKLSIPSYPATWSNMTFSWADSRSLSDAKTEVWNTIKAARDANMAAGFVWDGSKFDSDNLSIQRIQGAVQLATFALAANQPFTIDWTLFDNSVRNLSATDLVQVYITLGTFVQNIFAAGVTLRGQIDAATVNSQLHSILWVNI